MSTDLARLEEPAERHRVEGADCRIAAVRAAFERAEWAAHVVGPDRLLIGRWGRWREVGIDEAEALLNRIVGTR